MPKLSKSLPAHRLHRPSGKGRVTLSGRTHYTGAWNTNAAEAEYHRLIALWLAGGRRTLVGDVTADQPVRVAGDDVPPRPTIAQVVNEYRKQFEAERAGRRTLEAEISLLQVSVGPLLARHADLQADSFGPKMLSELRREMAARKTGHGTRLGMRTINKQVAALKRVFRWAAEMELVSGSTWNALQAVRQLRAGELNLNPPKVREAVSLEDVNGALPFMSESVAAMVRVHLLCGMRSGELVQLRGRDIDFAAGSKGDLWAYTPPNHKTDRFGGRRQIWIGPEAQAVLQPWLQADPDAYLFSPARDRQRRFDAMRRRRKTPVQPSQRNRAKSRPRKVPGERYSSQSYGKAVMAAVKKAMQAGACKRYWSPHCLRHAHATLVDEAFGLAHAQQALGHSDARTTQAYVHQRGKRAEEVARRSPLAGKIA